MRRNFHVVKGMSVFAAVALALGLAGCSSVENVIAPPSLKENAKANPLGTAAPTRRCPDVVIREGEGVKTVYARGQEGNAKAVVYQAVIFDTARECASFGNTFEFRTGIRGRVTAGAAAQPGQAVTLTVTMTYQDEQSTLWQTIRQVPVTLDPAQGSVEFAFIEENGTALLPEGTDEFDYDITVGFAPDRR